VNVQALTTENLAPSLFGDPATIHFNVLSGVVDADVLGRFQDTRFVIERMPDNLVGRLTYTRTRVENGTTITQIVGTGYLSAAQLRQGLELSRTDAQGNLWTVTG